MQLHKRREKLDAVSIRTALSAATKTWLRQLTVLVTVDSTNAWLFRQRQPWGQVVLAEYQSAGKGRRGRVWSAGPGESIALSMAFERTQDLSEVSSLSLVAGLAVVDALGALGIEQIELKWPNDLLLKGAKLGGILTELHTFGSRTFVVVGVGLNICGAASLQQRWNRPVADLAQYFAPSATAGGEQICGNRLAASLINSLVSFEAAHRQNGFEPMRRVWQDLHRYQGRQVCIEAGNSITRGVVAGVSPRGELMLETKQGVRQFSAGEVSLLDLEDNTLRKF